MLTDHANSAGNSQPAIAPVGVVRVAVPSPLRRLFDYRLPETVDAPLPGARVRVPFGRRSTIGVVAECAETSAVPEQRLRNIAEIIDATPLLDAATLRVLRWAATYYHHAPGDVYLSAFPVALRRAVKSRAARSASEPPERQTPEAAPTPGEAQRVARDRVAADFGRFAPFLLDGVTGSGKTEVYLQLARMVMERAQQVLILVPEIGLTPQIVTRFARRFDAPIAVLHSGLGDAQRAREWHAAQQGRARIVIGTRSAVFTPLPQLGLIIVDEEHDASFKQQEGFRYHARDVAVVRAREQGVPVVLGSATPALESLHNARQGRYVHLRLTERAGSASAPTVEVIDVRRQPMVDSLSRSLREAIAAELHAGHQVLLFLNRRGYAPTWYCHDCGWIARCERCDANLVVHQRSERLRCHHCGADRRIDRVCPGCHGGNLHALGAGTERVEQALAREFGDAGVARVDRDSTRRKGALAGVLADIEARRARLLIGTQMLAKGHHFPGVTLVGVLNTDQGLLSADFRASERMAQLLTQVGGRAGRAEHPGRVLIQTACPDHPLLRVLLGSGYAAFAELALQERSDAELPPFTHLALVRAEAARRDLALEFLGRLDGASKGVRVLGPTPAPMEKRVGHFRAQLMVLAAERAALHRTLSAWIDRMDSDPQARRVRWSVDVDPVELF
jgi:primosomal protein N' (replication factor Y)